MGDLEIQMIDRVQAYLDGEIARNELSEAERARVAELETATTGVASAMRSVRTPDFTAAVMRALPAAPPQRYEFPVQPAGPFSWLGRPVALKFRPVFLLAAAAAAVAALALYPTEMTLRGTNEIVADVPADAPMIVQFRLEVAQAEKVAIVGSFTGWEPMYEMAQVAPGQWSVLVPMPPGVHDYFFVVDGERRVVDPYARRIKGADGVMVSRLFLARPKPPEAKTTRVAAQRPKPRPEGMGAAPVPTGFGEN